MRGVTAFLMFLICEACLLSCGQTKTERTTPEPAALAWSTFLGGSGDEEICDLFVDPLGNIYLTGWTQSEDFPATPGAFETTSHGGGDVFVVKIDPQGGRLLYATLLGGGDWEEGFGIVVDEKGRAYLCGRTRSSDFPARNAFQTTHRGGYDAFVAQLDPQGGQLLWAGLLGGRDYDRASSIVLDRQGRAYLVGWTKSLDFPTTSQALSRHHHGPAEEDAFVAVVSPAGDSLVYATYLGGSGEDWGRDIALDRFEHVVVAVLTDSPDLPTTSGAFDRAYNGSREAYIARVDLWGQRLLSATYLGGRNQDWPEALALDGSGRIHVAGVTFSGDFPITPGAIDSTHHGYSDVFVAVLDSSGSTLLYATFLGGADQDRSTSIAVEDGQRLYLTGWTKSVDFPTTSAASDTVFHGLADAFVALIDPWENRLAFSSFLGGSEVDVGSRLGMNGEDYLFLAGNTRSADFPITPGAPFSTHQGGDDAFVVALHRKMMRQLSP